MLNFCTLFDYNFLPYGMALYESLKKYCGEFHLYVLALDNRCFKILKKLNVSNITIISLTEFENARLKKVKSSRSWTEYCWTCTSSVIDYVLKKYKVKICTYLDADIYFFASPRILLDELGTDSVIITKHRFTNDVSDKFGKYCVQFMTFKNNKNGRKVLKWWKNKTIDWCYARVEDGKFGDQKYLDNWTTQFEKVHELQHLGGGVAPWNVQQYKIIEENGQLFGVERSTQRRFRIVFYHFAGLRFYQKNIIQLASKYTLSEQVILLLYKPYIQRIETIRTKLKKSFPGLVFSYKLAPAEPEFFNWFFRNLKIETSKLIGLFSLKTTIERYRLNNIYYKNRFIENN